MSEFFNFISANGLLLLKLTWWHLCIVVLSGAIAVGIALPLGVLVTRPGWRNHAGTVLAMANVFQTIPSLAVIGLSSALLAFVKLGIGWTPAIVALVLYSILPVLSNTIVGLEGVNQSVLRAARGMGMNNREMLYQIEIPLALPTIFAGVRTALVINIGTAALAAAIGAECLGTLIFQGISTGNLSLLLAGAIPTALLAIAMDAGLGRMERKLVSPGIRTRQSGA